jgi:5'-nucleotidase/UDP-sugar diphosphatase
VLINAGNGNLNANDVIDYIIKSGGVTAALEGRIKIVGN